MPSPFFLGSLFGGGEDPQHYMNNIPGLYDPYRNYGAGAGGILSDQYGRMSQDPNAFINKLMENYKPSTTYQTRLREGLKTAGAAAAAGGMRGTSSDIREQSGIEDRLMGEDMQQYLSNLFNVQGRGLAGEQSLYNTGYGATGDMANYYNQQGSMAQHQRDQQMALLNSIIQGASYAAGRPPGRVGY